LPQFIHGPRLALIGLESVNEQDLNADGDTDDKVLHILDIDTGEVLNTGFSLDRWCLHIYLCPGRSFPFFGWWKDKLIFSISKSGDDVALINDGFGILAIADLASQQLTEISLESYFVHLIGDRYVVLYSDEPTVYDLETGNTLKPLSAVGRFIDLPDFKINSPLPLFNPGDVLHIIDYNGNVFNLGISGVRSAMAWKNWLALGVSEGSGRDLNLDGEHFDVVLHLYQLNPGSLLQVRRMKGDQTIFLVWVSGTLQETASLSNPEWSTVPLSENQTNFPIAITENARFFRVNP
jgi:hypothetical protein